MIAWLYLLIASCLEVCWIYSLKFLDMKKIIHIKPATLFQGYEAWFTILPLVGYIVFGLSNVIFISMGMKTIPPPTAFAVWMGLAMVLSKIVDIFIFKEPYNIPQIIFTVVVLIGIIGLKIFDKSGTSPT
jgi:quaternary ammonium compound-resistance protein SugE